MNLTITPDAGTFATAAAEHGRRIISVWTRLFADDVTPVALYHHLCTSSSVPPPTSAAAADAIARGMTTIDHAAAAAAVCSPSN